MWREAHDFMNLKAAKAIVERDAARAERDDYKLRAELDEAIRTSADIAEHRAYALNELDKVTSHWHHWEREAARLATECNQLRADLESASRLRAEKAEADLGEALVAMRESQLLFTRMRGFVKSYGLSDEGPHSEYGAWLQCRSDFEALKLRAAALLAKHPEAPHAD